MITAMPWYRLHNAVMPRGDYGSILLTGMVTRLTPKGTLASNARGRSFHGSPSPGYRP
jgi:hypothetical protein